MKYESRHFSIQNSGFFKPFVKVKIIKKKKVYNNYQYRYITTYKRIYSKNVLKISTQIEILDIITTNRHSYRHKGLRSMYIWESTFLVLLQPYRFLAISPF